MREKLLKGASRVFRAVVILIAVLVFLFVCYTCTIAGVPARTEIVNGVYQFSGRLPEGYWFFIKSNTPVNVAIGSQGSPIAVICEADPSLSFIGGETKSLNLVGSNELYYVVEGPAKCPSKYRITIRDVGIELTSANTFEIFILMDPGTIFAAVIFSGFGISIIALVLLWLEYKLRLRLHLVN